MKRFFLFYLFTGLLTGISAQSANYLKQYVHYTVWANEQLQQWMLSADEAVSRQEVESSFSSLYTTSIHLWNAEHGWLTLLRGEKWESPGTEFNGTFIEMCAQWANASQAFLQFVDAMTEDEFAATFPASKRKAMSASEIILHVCNHATYHRGQLITIGRQLGLPKPPRTDFIYFTGLD